MTRLELVGLRESLEVGKLGKWLVCETDGYIDELLELIARRNIKRGYEDCMKWLSASIDNLSMLEDAINHCLIDTQKNVDFVEWIERTQIENNLNDLFKHKDNIVKYYVLDYLINVKQLDFIENNIVFDLFRKCKEAYYLDEIKEAINEYCDI